MWLGIELYIPQIRPLRAACFVPQTYAARQCIGFSLHGWQITQNNGCHSLSHCFSLHLCISDRVMDGRKGKYMSQSIPQQFCCAHQLGRVRTGFPLQHCAISSSSISEGLSQVAIQRSHNLQVYLCLCFVFQYF